MARIDDATWRLADVLRGIAGKPRQQAVRARCVRTDPDGTAWVVAPGGTEPTPIPDGAATISAGDEVSLSAGAVPTVTGNLTSPAASMRDVVRRVLPVEDIAKSAKAIAEATGQHFWHDDNGAHVSTEEGNPTGAQNTVWNSLGMLFRAGVNNLLAIVAGTDSGMDVYDGNGNQTGNVLASFRGSGVRIGRTSESHQWLDYHSMQMVDKDGDTYFHVSDLRGSDGYATVAESFVADSVRVFILNLLASEIMSVKVNGVAAEYTSQTVRNVTYVTLAAQPTSGATVLIEYETADRRAKAYTIGLRATGSDVGALSVAMGLNSIASGIYAHSEGCGTTASNDACHSEGMSTVASGLYSHAEGYASQATGGVLQVGTAFFTAPSHAEGYDTTASNGAAHAEGGSTVASGGASHAEGLDTTASGDFSHAEGAFTTASGKQSHTQNYHTVAAYESQTAIGKYNANDPDNAFEIGNGTSDSARSNAFAVDWSGNVSASGDVTATGDVAASNVSASEDMSVAGDLAVSGDATASGNLTASNFRDAAMTRDLSNSGIVRACRIGNMLVMSGSLSGCTVSDTFAWTHLAHIDPSVLGITSVGALGSLVDVSGGGPSYYGSTNGGGTARIVDGVLYADMQTNAAFTNKFVKFVITAYVE